MINNEKTPPYDIDAEEAVIGSLLIDSESIQKVADLLNPGDFFREKNQWAFQACLNLYERNEAINQITTAQELARQEKLEALGGAAYLSQLVSNVPTSLHIEYYAQIVYRLSMMRQLIDAASLIADIGYNTEPDVDIALDKAENVLYQLHRRDSPRNFITVKKILNQLLEEDVNLQNKERPKRQLPTGFNDLDAYLGGLQRSDMIVLGARPSLGKSSFALNIARNAAVQHSARVALFSLEMSKEQLVNRLLSSESGLNQKQVRFSGHSEIEEKVLMDAMGKLSETAIYIDDSPISSIAEIRIKAKRLANEIDGLDLIIVDYMGLVRTSGRYQNRVQEMSEISRSLKALARDLDVPVLAISQLSRAVELRPDHRPQLSDLRESGDIEQDADVVMFIHREDKHISKEEWDKNHPTENFPDHIAEIIIAKHRNGPTGQLKLYFREECTKFENLAKANVSTSMPLLK
ncbi:MAG: replicative DNA helicase [Chloroflexi bacterium]|nr:replicative DNA helicase [Chloroflexota bacterium]